MKINRNTKKKPSFWLSFYLFKAKYMFDGIVVFSHGIFRVKPTVLHGKKESFKSKNYIWRKCKCYL